MKKIIYILLPLLLAACEVPQPPENVTTGNTDGSKSSLSGIFTWPGEIKEGENIQTSPDLFVTNVIIAIDTSGSMGDRCDGKVKFDEAVNASKNFLKLVPNDANIGLINFGGNASIVNNLTNNRSSIITGINSLYSGGGTPMSEALSLANDIFTAQGKAQRGNGKYHLIVIGDGAPDSRENTGKWLDYFIWNTPVQVHAIGFCAELDIMQRKGMNYKTAKNSGEIIEIFREVMAEIDLKADEQGLNITESW